MYTKENAKLFHKMPERFKVTKAEVPDAEAVSDQLLPNYEEATSNNQQKGKYEHFY